MGNKLTFVKSLVIALIVLVVGLLIDNLTQIEGIAKIALISLSGGVSSVLVFLFWKDKFEK